MGLVVADDLLVFKSRRESQGFVQVEASAKTHWDARTV
jgi:hypothetical protein